MSVVECKCARPTCNAGSFFDREGKPMFCCGGCQDIDGHNCHHCPPWPPAQQQQQQQQFQPPQQQFQQQSPVMQSPPQQQQQPVIPKNAVRCANRNCPCYSWSGLHTDHCCKSCKNGNPCYNLTHYPPAHPQKQGNNNKNDGKKVCCCC